MTAIDVPTMTTPRSGFELPIGFELVVPDTFHRGEAFVIYPDRLIWFRKRDHVHLPAGYCETTDPANVLAMASIGPKAVVPWAEVVKVSFAPVCWHGALLLTTQRLAGRVDVATRQGIVITALLDPKDRGIARDTLARLLGNDRVKDAPAPRLPRWNASSLPVWFLYGALSTICLLLALRVSIAFLVGPILTAPVLIVLAPLAFATAYLGVLLVLRIAVGAVQRVVLGPPRHSAAKDRQPLHSPIMGVIAKLLGVCVYVGLFLISCQLSMKAAIEGETSLSATGVVVAGWLLASVFITFGYRLSLPSGTDVMARGGQPPILFLRSFDDDAEYDYNPKGFAAWALGLHAPLGQLLGPLGNLVPQRLFRLLAQIGADTAEEQIGQGLARHGVLVAIGRPGELLSLGGAARVYASDENWRAVIRDLLDRAVLVVLQPGESEGVWWEINELFQRIPRERVVLSLLHFRTAPARWEMFRIRMQERLGISLPNSIEGALFIGFDKKGDPFLLKPVYRNVLAMAFKGCCIDFEKTLAPVLGIERPVASREPGFLSLLLGILVINGALVGANFTIRRFVAEPWLVSRDAHSRVEALAHATVKVNRFAGGLTIRLPEMWTDLGFAKDQPDSYRFALGISAMANFYQLRQGDLIPGSLHGSLFDRRAAWLVCPTAETLRGMLEGVAPPGSAFQQVRTFIDGIGRPWTELEFVQPATITQIAHRATLHCYCDGERLIVVTTEVVDSQADMLAPIMGQVLDAVGWDDTGLAR